MTEKDYRAATIWGIHGGRTGEADGIFLKHSQVALGWERVGDLRQLGPHRDALKEKVAEAYPERKLGYYPTAAGQLFRFAYEVKEGDLIVYPSKRDRRVHLGEIIGPYQYLDKSADSYPHRRAVKWIVDFARTKFSQGALYEIGAALSFFQVKNYADEFLAAVGGQIVPPPPNTDDSVTYIAEDIQQNTRDFVLKTLAQELKGHALTDFIAHLLGTMGYRTRVAPVGPDGGIDIVAHKDELGFVPPIVKVQVKSTEGNVGDPVVAQLIGKLESGEYGMLVTLGSFTSQALSTARNKSNLRLVDGQDLVNMVLQHYDQFDSKYKGLLPLRSVYVPEPLNEGEE